VTHVRVVAPASMPERPVVLCWFPGGGMSSRYFDLDPPYDMAGHLAALGFVNLLVDHPAVGGGAVPDDPWTLTPEAVADADAEAVRQALDELDLDDPLVIGGGHSMGAMLVVHQQARHRLYDGLALLGHSGRGLPEVLTPDELAGTESVVELARKRFGQPLPQGETAGSEMLVGPSLPAAAAAALDAARAPLLVVCGLAAMLPGSHADELASVDVPVFLGIAEHDITGPPHEAPSHLTGTTDVTLHVVRGGFHNSNVADRRVELWDRLALWARTVPA
jgi:hypothetical protein